MAPPVMVASFFLLPWAGRPLQFFTILAGLERIGHHLVRALEVLSWAPGAHLAAVEWRRRTDTLGLDTLSRSPRLPYMLALHACLTWSLIGGGLPLIAVARLSPVGCRLGCFDGQVSSALARWGVALPPVDFLSGWDARGRLWRVWMPLPGIGCRCGCREADACHECSVSHFLFATAKLRRHVTGKGHVELPR